jgi:hypothetical protein
MSELQNTQIVLPDGVGDAILSLPAILCLKQLAPEAKVVIYPPFRLFEILWSLKIFETQFLEEIIKVHSWFDPAEQTIYLNRSARAFGLHSKKSYGEVQPGKWYTKYNINLPYLNINRVTEHLPAELISFLRDKFHFSLGSICYFGFLLELGFTVQDVQKTFSFNLGSLELQNNLNHWEPDLANKSYLVFCTEASYGSKGAAARRWPAQHFIELANLAYQKYKLLPVFVGTDTQLRLPKGFVDMRCKLTLLQVAQLMRYSKGYIGNDSGNLHLANLMKTPTIGIYQSTSSSDYGPIFESLNLAVNKPQSAEEVFNNYFDRFLSIVGS